MIFRQIGFSHVIFGDKVEVMFGEMMLKRLIDFHVQLEPLDR